MINNIEALSLRLALQQQRVGRAKKNSDSSSSNNNKKHYALGGGGISPVNSDNFPVVR